MDQEHQGITGDPIVITGIGVEGPAPLLSADPGKQFSFLGEKLAHDCTPLEFLKQKKTLKFMSKQDRLAVNGAGRAIKAAELTEEDLRHDTGVFLTVGYIPFEFDVAADLCSKSVDACEFSMKKFSTAGIDNVNPLIAFTCLPNMPAHHIAMNFGINGEYQITYPDILQFYLGLEEAVYRLEEGRTAFALVGGVADQNNFLVKHHFKKIAPELLSSLADTAAFIVLEKESSARARNVPIMAGLDSFQIYQSDPFSFRELSRERVIESGPAQLIVELFRFINHESKTFSHNLENWGNRTFSSWVKP